MVEEVRLELSAVECSPKRQFTIWKLIALTSDLHLHSEGSEWKKDEIQFGVGTENAPEDQTTHGRKPNTRKSTTCSYRRLVPLVVDVAFYYYYIYLLYKVR